MKILITGANGQLGRDCTEILSARHQLSCCDVPNIDITDPDQVARVFTTCAPDVVINCAAYTNVDGCEVHHDDAFKANALGPRNLAQAAEKTGARLVHVSTDYVFSGRENGGIPQDEATLPGPISAYGSTKLMGEKYVERFCHRHFIVRTAWLYSYYGKNCAESTLAVSDYSIPVTGAVRAGKVYGTQFHPEKSANQGLALYRNFLHWKPGDHTRLAVKMQVHYRLNVDADGRPMLQVFNTCKHFIRTVPNLVYDEKNVEDINTEGEDHIYDELRYVCMKNPIAPRRNKPPALVVYDPLDLGQDQQYDRYDFYRRY